MKRLFFCMAILTATVSCVKERVETLPATEGEAVCVPISLRLDSESSGTPVYDIPYGDSRAIDDPEADNGASTEIADLWVLQFNGTTDAATMVGVPTYIDNYSSLEASQQQVKLVTSISDNTVVFLANTCDKNMVFPQGYTLGDLKRRSKSIAKQADLFGMSDDAGSGEYPDNATYHPMFNGFVRITITPETPAIECLLRRNIVRINLNVKVAEEAKLHIDKVELYYAPAVSYYFTNYAELPALFPNANSFNSVDFDSPTTVVDLGDGRISYRFYTSVNRRGSVTNTNEAYKNRYAPYDATRAIICATYTEGDEDIPIFYTFYLGANLVDDFNLSPNYKYTYEIDILDKGDAKADLRIDDWGLADFTTEDCERANCYIINPAPSSSYTRRFRLPVDRIDEFWGNRGYENMSNYILGSSIDWAAEVIWADFDYTAAGVSVTKSTGKGSSDYFEISVPGGVSGNMVIGVRQPGKTGILWSWHLWITNYRPDQGADFSPEAGRYIYHVGNGSIHRYAGTPWESGRYANRFIMDRNVGALTDGYVGSGRGALYYQFGRKDPFPGAITLYGKDGSHPTVTAIGITNVNDGDLRTVIYAVQNPLKFITNAGMNIDDKNNNAWTYGDIYNPTTHNASVVWFDPQALSTATNLPKSIFDPCPPGWCLPLNDVFSDFRTNTASNPTTNVGGGDNPLRGFTSFSSAERGLRYGPYSEDRYNVGDEIYIPASGYRLYNNGGFANVGNIGNYWYGISRDTSRSAHLQSSSATLYLQGSNPQSFGFPVRCVRK
ncbi:MAG: hypothetical protein ACI35M_01665 [Alistipes sp.]